MAKLNDKGEEWSGDFEKQKIIAHLMMYVARNEHPIDICGAAGTVVANLICDYAGTKEDALEGLAAWYGDIHDTIMLRFRDPKFK